MAYCKVPFSGSRSRDKRCLVILISEYLHGQALSSADHGIFGHAQRHGARPAGPEYMDKEAVPALIFFISKLRFSEARRKASRRGMTPLKKR